MENLQEFDFEEFKKEAIKGLYSECIKKCGAIDFFTNLKEYNSFKNESPTKEETSPSNCKS